MSVALGDRVRVIFSWADYYQGKYDGCDFVAHERCGSQFRCVGYDSNGTACVVDFKPEQLEVIQRRGERT